jgi:hypothetical protein
MKAKTKAISCFLVVLAILTIAPAAHATLMPPNTTVTPTVGFEAGAVLADTGSVAYNFGLGTQMGTVREWVVANTLNPLGGVAFVYQFSVTTGLISRLTGGLYDAVMVDVEQNPGGGGQVGVVGSVPDFTADRGPTGNTVGFNFSPKVPAGSTSWLLIVNTDVPFFGPGVIGLIDSGSSGDIPGFAPAARTVPEPASMLLLGTGLIAVAAFQRKRSRRG